MVGWRHMTMEISLFLHYQMNLSCGLDILSSLESRGKWLSSLLPDCSQAVWGSVSFLGLWWWLGTQTIRQGFNSSGCMSLGSHLLVMTKSWMAAHQWREHTPLCWFVQGNVGIQLALVLLPVWPCGFLLRSEINICWWLIFLSAWAKDLEQATWIHLSITMSKTLMASANMKQPETPSLQIRTTNPLSCPIMGTTHIGTQSLALQDMIRNREINH